MTIRGLKKNAWAIGLMFISLLLLTQSNAFARGRIVYIFGSWEDGKITTSIEPKTASVERNTTVIWLNESQVEVKINFPEGKTCDLATLPAKNWGLKGTCYITNDVIPPGGTSSIYFKRIGKFDYEVEYVGKDHIEKGCLRVSTQPGYPAR